MRVWPLLLLNGKLHLRAINKWVWENWLIFLSTFSWHSLVINWAPLQFLCNVYLAMHYNNFKEIFDETCWLQASNEKLQTQKKS